MVIGKQIVFYNNSNITYFTPVQEASDKFFSIYSVDNTNINIKTQNENWTGGDFYFILYYLKK